MNLISQNISIDQKLILAIIPKFKVLKTHHEKITATTTRNTNAEANPRQTKTS